MAPPDAARWALFDRHEPAVRAYAARRVEPDAVDDVVAETFAIAWRRLPRTDEPLPWLYAVARRVVHGHRRSHARRAALRGRLAAVTSRAAAPDPLELLGSDAGLAEAMRRLSDREREAVMLVALEDLDRAAAARAAGCSVATFDVRLSRARAKLRRALDTPALPRLEAAHG